MTTQESRINELLTATDEWPVDNAVAAVRDSSGSWSVHGDTDKVYALASVTKLLSAHAVLLAIEEGVFEGGLDEPLGPPGATVRHLLSHASGVGFADRTPEKEPGERRIYSSAGFDIIADAIRDETGMQFSEYLSEATFAPLGMDSSRLVGSAGHAVESSAGDVMRFLDEILEPTLLHPDTVDEALTVQFPGLDGVVPGYGMQKPADWGLGFEIYSHSQSRQGLWFGNAMPNDVSGHFGQSGTFAWVHRPSGRAGVVLTDQPFGGWAKPLWADWNDEMWKVLAD